MGNSPFQWPIVFATMVHMLWIDRNHCVFSGRSAIPNLFLPKVLGQVEAFHTYLLKLVPSFIEASYEVEVRWLPPPNGCLKLNTDGSRQNGKAAYGGLLRNEMGQFVAGFHCNLGSVTSVHAELWGLTLGLRMARSRGIQRLLVELDSKVVVCMLSSRSTHYAHLQPVLEEAVSLIHSQDWSCSVSHIFREANHCADILNCWGGTPW